MPITFACTCGKQLKAREASAGKIFFCPSCQAPIEVPVPDGCFYPTRPETSPLAVDLGSPKPTRKPSAKKVVVVAPMNTVGLFSLLCALASYPPSAFAWLGVLAMVSNSLGIRGSFEVPLFFSVIGLALAGFGLFVCHLGRQRIVRPFSFWGVQAALLPFVVSLLAMLREILDRP